jgi:hypothetical protein
MLRRVLGVDEDIVQIHNYKIVKILSKQIIHCPLEGCWSIG